MMTYSRFVEKHRKCITANLRKAFENADKCDKMSPRGKAKYHEELSHTLDGFGESYATRSAKETP